MYSVWWWCIVYGGCVLMVTYGGGGMLKLNITKMTKSLADEKTAFDSNEVSDPRRTTTSHPL